MFSFKMKGVIMNCNEYVFESFININSLFKQNKKRLEKFLVVFEDASRVVICKNVLECIKIIHHNIENKKYKAVEFNDNNSEFIIEFYYHDRSSKLVKFFKIFESIDRMKKFDSLTKIKKKNKQVVATINKHIFYGNTIFDCFIDFCSKTYVNNEHIDRIYFNKPCKNNNEKSLIHYNYGQVGNTSFVNIKHEFSI